MKRDLIKSTPRLLLKSFLLIIIILSQHIFSKQYHWGSRSVEKTTTESFLQNNEKLLPFDAISMKGVEVRKGSLGQVIAQRHQTQLANFKILDEVYLPFDQIINNGITSKQPLLYNAKVQKSFFKFRSFPDSVKQALSFEQPMHQVNILLPKFSFMNNRKQFGDFTIRFHLRAYQMKSRMEVFRKGSLFSGKKFGLYCVWREGRLFFDFINLFRRADGSFVKVSIATREKLRVNHFEKIQLVYVRSTGMLRLYLNEKEQETFYVTRNFKPNATVLLGSFHAWDHSAFILGKSLLGSLDEMLLSNKVLERSYHAGKYFSVTRRGNSFEQKPGVFISKRYVMKYSSGKITRFSSIVRVPVSANVKFFLRNSNRPFSPSDVTGLGFREIRLKKQKIGDNLYHFSEPLVATRKGSRIGKYFQFMLKLYASYDGKSTPSVYNIKISTQENRPPRHPMNLQVASTKKTSVTLRFLRNVELDVIHGGRYLVYYGVQPYKPLGIIRFKDIKVSYPAKIKTVNITDRDKRSSADLTLQNRVYVTVNNELISKHIYWSKDKPLKQFSYPLLQENIPYFFWVTACDNQWQDTPETNDHESKPSKYIIIRPGQ